ncbi:type II toxin-antitoxin system RelE/ParE family toxin [Micromonospora sp. NPDC000207]|uniref:type II toxin-antitoxin system RelE/ParE family toxin n=1 Tax=Micromonospora sp. NPDC000207 TaxID=3154246 RepID=UPI00332E8A43
MIEAARAPDGNSLADAFLMDMARTSKGISRLADVAMRFEDFARTGDLEIPRELNELVEDLWEIKVQKVRLPFFWLQKPFDSTAVRLTHGFMKGTEKTPRKEIYRAMWVRKADLEQ